MATTEAALQPHDRPDRAGRRRPFSTWVKKLTNFKGSSSSDGTGVRLPTSKRQQAKLHPKLRASKNNNPYPQSGRVGSTSHADVDVDVETSSYSFSTALSGSATSIERSSRMSSDDDRAPNTAGARSMAPTISTDHDGAHSAPSHGPPSVAGTSRTVGGVESRRGGDSTFSSPAPSVRSLTTTLTTIQSVAPNNGGTHMPTNAINHGNHTSHQGHTQSIHFNQPFPTASPASAIPAHLAPITAGSSSPTTYMTATANNLLTDNASIITLASSSQRRRRRSLDTDASVRALAPSSLWGGSRESLPLSVLSANIDQGAGMPTTPGLHQSTSRIANAERTSIYSTTGIPPATSSYPKQSGAGDGASIRSGMLGHGRADSINGSIGGVTSPLISPQEASEKDDAEDGGEGSSRARNDEER
ncbi:uncharacterized protein LY79DRAFT_587930 [Colletotrichum navitas]|uniref:Ca2+-modulated nonselective cation channel polycystin n=1 Tax=Colletotrichum navitas TaxID=681940 RepID=A0AAD8Q6S8_9PEZI|nr:uncharacterized protein LY79DRAFT_587930 [Colletotrichum navitas]KAK1596694.1 hypothetical protein LY79DRAFT_587930 [Colletotrichum navitas]